MGVVSISVDVSGPAGLQHRSFLFVFVYLFSFFRLGFFLDLKVDDGSTHLNCLLIPGINLHLYFHQYGSPIHAVVVLQGPHAVLVHKVGMDIGAGDVIQRDLDPFAPTDREVVFVAFRLYDVYHSLGLVYAHVLLTLEHDVVLVYW